MNTQENIQSEQGSPFDGIQENRERKPPAYFNLLFYGLIIWGVLFMGYFLLSGWSSHDEFQAKMNAHTQKYSGQVTEGK